MNKVRKYEDLENEMLVKGIAKEELADKIHIPLKRMESKLDGKDAFTIHEAEEISRVLNLKYPTKYFFK
ncbi:MAG: hypothetical protein MJA31_09215 [Clostridia bacterium]|nr:hypothetical protein [Clostridia bacterium]